MLFYPHNFAYFIFLREYNLTPGEEFLAGRHHFMVDPALALVFITEMSLEDFLPPKKKKKTALLKNINC